MITWIIQDNLTSENTKWYDALEKLGCKFKKITIVPFSDELPDVEVEGKTIAYGSTTLIKNAPKKGWGIYFNQENFKCSKWHEVYGEEMFNFDGEIMTLEESASYPLEIMFMRPNDDLKSFSGMPTNKADVVEFYNNVKAGGFPFDTSLEVFVAPLKDICKEWRLFIVAGKAVASSQYRIRGVLSKKADTPQEVIDYAERMAASWSPEPAFVIDICSNNDGILKILELNCFNASGLYECDVENIIKSITDLEQNSQNALRESFITK